MSGKMIRLFAAAPIPYELRAKLAVWCQENRRDYPFQKWTHRDDLHITLFFLGDTEEHRLKTVQAALREAASTEHPFRLQLGRIGSFGPPAAPKILWTGVEGDREPLSSLQKSVQRSLVQLGFPHEDRPYRPHITLARRYNGNGPWSPPNQTDADLPIWAGRDWICDRVTLYRSHLGQNPMYESLAELPLA